jgi:hypothetical protein
MTTFGTWGIRLLAVSAAACTSIYASSSESEGRPIAPRPNPPPASSPYTFELVDEAGNGLDTYQHGGRFYVLGGPGARYAIRVTNPTDRRIEAIVSVDGLDVIDGEDADYRGKRGYIVAPRDTLLIEGFRTSQSAVAAFRFSSVADSYAGRKGKARNVGVIGVAIFEERAEPVVATPIEPTPSRHPRYDFDDGGGIGVGGSPPADATAKSGADAPAASVPPQPAPPAPRRRAAATEDEGRYAETARPQHRPGLGTAYGEQRWSAVSFTSFTRASTTPAALAELRYNDADGLAALGIRLRPAYDPGEVAQRESADPFPGQRWAQPPP